MTSFNTSTGRDRDQQDMIERHVFGSLEHTSAGAIVRVRGTGTEDIEAPVLVMAGAGVNFAENTNTEVFLLASASDPNQKYAILTIPRDKQRKWKAGTGGVQHPTDPTRAFEFNEKRTFLDDGAFATRGGNFEIKDGNLYVRGDLYVSGQVLAAGGYVGPSIHNAVGTVDVPGFEA